jgi:hypothetical protein
MPTASLSGAGPFISVEFYARTRNAERPAEAGDGLVLTFHVDQPVQALSPICLLHESHRSLQDLAL